MNFIHHLKDGTAIEMTLVGTWMDLSNYYRGSDSNYWAFQKQMVCLGPKIRNCRGKTLEGHDIETLPELK